MSSRLQDFLHQLLHNVAMHEETRQQLHEQIDVLHEADADAQPTETAKTGKSTATTESPKV